MSAVAAQIDEQDDDLNPGFDWRNPDYVSVFRERANRLSWLRSNPQAIPQLKALYAMEPWRFVNDWGFTFDPRQASKGELAWLPFLLFPRQVQFLRWVHTRVAQGERGLCEKSRDMGVSWLVVGYACALFCCQSGFVIGMGSRKEELVDKLGDDKSLFEKVRTFMSYIPPELYPDGFDPMRNSAYMRLWSPLTGASIIGESGDQIGRGGRTSLYFVDEAAFVVHQDLVDRALSANTNCQIDVSSVNGNGNAFYKKRMRFNGTPRVFIFDWRQDPRKDQAWYNRKLAEEDAITVAQEIDRDYNASQDNQFINAKWVSAAVDAHKRLGYAPGGLRVVGFDPADVGDAKAVVKRWGSVIYGAEQLKTGDVTHAIPWAFEYAAAFNADVLRYDGDGMGTPVMRMQLTKAAGGKFRIMAFNGGGAVEDPDEIYSAAQDKDDDTERTNKDRFANYRSQAWTHVRDRFAATHAAMERAEKGLLVSADSEDLISLDSAGIGANLVDLMAELSRPMRLYSNNGKILVESKKQMKSRGVDSPNLADALVMSVFTRRPNSGIVLPRMQPRRLTDRGAGY